MRGNNMQSELEKHLTTQNTFRRNKQHYDAQEQTKIQRIYSMKRRKPQQFSLRQVEDKVKKSFQSSQVNLSEKVAIGIQAYRGRLSQTQFLSKKQQNPQSMAISSPKKGVPLVTMTSRQYHDNLKIKPISDQRLFNNFQLKVPNTDRTFNLSKSPTREIQFSHKHMHDIFYQTQRPYQQNYYKKSVLQCTFDYKKQKPIPRYFFCKRRQIDNPATDLQPQDVKKSFDAVTTFDNFKGIPFYFDSGKELPSQLELRQMSPNRDYWRNKQDKFQRPKMDFSLRKVKDDIIKTRLDEIKSKKKSHITRKQICDERYFKMNKTSIFYEPVIEIQS